MAGYPAVDWLFTLLFRYLVGQSADGDMKVKFESIEFVKEVDLLDGVRDEKVTSNGIVVIIIFSYCALCLMIHLIQSKNIVMFINCAFNHLNL